MGVVGVVYAGGRCKHCAVDDKKIIAVRDLADHTAEYVRKELPKIYSRELIDIIFEQPYCRIGNLVEADIAKRQTASEYLKKLVGIGVLVEQQAGRERLFIHPKLMELITQDSNEIHPYSGNRSQ